MDKIKGKKQNLLNFLNQLETPAYQQCRYYCAHPALSLPVTIRIDRFWLSLIRMTVVAAAGCLCILILINTSLLVTRLSAALLGTDTSLVPDWISTFFSILYTVFTYSVIDQAQVNYIHLRQNQGKAAALNAGIARAKGGGIVFSDSDSWLHPMALRYLIERFSSPKTGAVSGTVEIEQASNLLKKLQVIEYIFGQFFVKTAQLGSGSSVAICNGYARNTERILPEPR